jgi:hypothetical protein
MISVESGGLTIVLWELVVIRNCLEGLGGTFLPEDWKGFPLFCFSGLFHVGSPSVRTLAIAGIVVVGNTAMPLDST